MKLLQLLARIPFRLRISLIGLLVVALPTVVFASGGGITEEIYDVIAWLLKFLSWAWIIPASIAGKLMTNDFVYASFMHFDRYLWKMRQFMRAIAMYSLIVLFLVSLLRYFFRGTINDLLVKTGKIALCAILIPLSWWMMAVLIDISIVLTTAVGAIPLQITQQQRNQMSQNFLIPKKIIVNDGRFLDPLNNVSFDNYQNMELENIMPKADSVAGPLIFLGASVLRIQELVYLPTGGEDNFKNIALGSLLKILIVISVFVPIIILAVVNMVRIFYIWLWVVMSPFVVITHIFKEFNLGDNIAKHFKLSHLLGLIFQPPIIVGLLSLGMIMIIGVSSVLVGNQEFREELEEFHIYVNTEQTTTILGPPDIAEVKVKGQLVSDFGPQVGGAMGELILMFFIIFVLWALVKAGFTVSTLTESIANTGYNLAETYMSTSKILPGGYSPYTLRQTTNKMKYSLTTNRGDEEAEHLINKFYGSDNEFASLADFAAAKRASQTNTDVNAAASGFWGEVITVGQTKQFKGSTRAFKKTVESWLIEGKGLDYLKEKNIITDNERSTYDRNNISQIWSNPKFNGFVNEILTTRKREPSKHKSVRELTSIADKTYGNVHR